MTNNPLTAAALGLKIGILLCLCLGCEPAKQEPADDETVQEAIENLPCPPAPPAPERSAPVVESQADEWNRFAVDYPYLAADFQRLQERVKTLEKAPKCCPLPVANVPDKPNPPPILRPKSGLPLWMSDIANGHRYVVLVFGQPNCKPCDAFESDVLDTEKWKSNVSIDDCEVHPVNIRENDDLRTHFEVSMTPSGAVWDTNQDKWHPIGFNGNDSAESALSKLEGAINALNAPDAKSDYARKRLRNLFN